jgi:3-isopropylmalate dehydrogenase
MLVHLNEDSAARRIESAVMKVVLDDIQDLSVGEIGRSTSEIGDLVVDYIQKDV